MPRVTNQLYFFEFSSILLPRCFCLKKKFADSVVGMVIRDRVTITNLFYVRTITIYIRPLLKVTNASLNFENGKLRE